MTLQEHSAEIDNAISIKALQWHRELEAVNAKLEEKRQISLEAKAQGDFSENAELSDAKSAIEQLNVQRRDLTIKLEALETYTENYKPSGCITIGATVRLFHVGSSSEKIVKIVPHGLDFAEDGACSEKSTVGKMLLYKNEKDIVSVNTVVGKQVYEIREVY